MLRELWTAMGVPKFDQDQVIASIERKATPEYLARMFQKATPLTPHHWELCVSTRRGPSYRVIARYDEYEPALRHQQTLEYERGYVVFVRPGFQGEKNGQG